MAVKKTPVHVLERIIGHLDRAETELCAAFGESSIESQEENDLRDVRNQVNALRQRYTIEVNR